MLREIENICFRENTTERKNLHSKLLISIKDRCVKEGYRVYLEYPINFVTVRRRDLECYKRHGYIDLIAQKNKSRIAIEFDSEIHLKFKSIEKLLQSNADTCLGIVRGSLNEPGLICSNTKRILEVRNEFRVDKKIFWLIIISEQSVYKIDI